MDSLSGNIHGRDPGRGQHRDLLLGMKPKMLEQRRLARAGPAGQKYVLASFFHGSKSNRELRVKVNGGNGFFHI